MNIFTFRTDPTTDPVTTDTYAAVPISGVDTNEKVTKLTLLTSGPLSVNWKNTGSNTIKCKILGHNNADAADADKKEVESEFTIAAGASAHKEIPLGYYGHYWFMHAANAGGSQGASQIFGRHSRI